MLSYSLSSAWDITTASFVAGVKFGDVGGSAMSMNYYHGIFAHPDGEHIYVLGSLDGYGCWVYDISLDTAWDITDNPTRVDDKYLNIYRWWYHRSIKFSTDGTKIYIAEEYNDHVLQFNLSTAWDVSSSNTNPSQLTDIESYDNQPKGVCFKSDGTKMMVMGGQYDTILYWTLTTAWNLYGETKDENEEDISDVVSSPNDIFCNPDGDHIFVVENNGYLYDFDFS
jgi:DNA-binding beta-propeller fold protein YncE